MKCISCGKNFDEDKYYRICPKCGTYNNVKRPEYRLDDDPAFWGGEASGQGARQSLPQGQANPYVQQGDHTSGQDIFYRTEQEMNARRQGTEKPASNKKLVISLLILVAVGVFLLITSVVLVMRQESPQDISDRLLEEELTETPVSLGEEFVLEEESGLPLSIQSVELVCEADTFADFPAGQKLVAVELYSPGGEIQEYAFDPSPLGSVYVAYETENGTSYKEALDGEDFNAYRSVIGDREAFNPWDIQYGDETRGYMYVFLPAAVNEGTVCVEARDITDNRVLEVYALDFTLGEVQ